MATVKIDRFGGVVPRVHPSLLPDGMAVVAHNCRLKSGKLVPLRQPSMADPSKSTVYFENGLSKISDAKSIHCWKHTTKFGEVRSDFLAFPGRVYFAHGNIADDEFDRVFVTGETGVEFTRADGFRVENSPCAYLFDRESNSIVRHTLCKEPLAAPRCSLKEELNNDISVSYSYFFLTWTDKYGYESEASPPSANKNDPQSVSYAENEPLAYNNASATVVFQPIMVPEDAWSVRVYKTVVGNETDNAMFIKEFTRDELPRLGNAFEVHFDETTEAETMPAFESAPVDLLDMSFVPGNYYAARAKSMPHTVLFSEVDVPTSWPMAYRYDVRDNIVKLAVTSNTVFALTDGFPYVLSGTAPESMTATSVSGPAACISEKAVCVFRNAVFFVSNYGLYTIYNDADAGTVCQCLTERFFTKEQWQALNPQSAIMGQFDNALHVFFKVPVGEAQGEVQYEYKSFIFDLSEQTMTITTNDEAATCLCSDDRTDDLYFVRRTAV